MQIVEKTVLTSSRSLAFAFLIESRRIFDAVRVVDQPSARTWPLD
jgi:hypothetical protein